MIVHTCEQGSAEWYAVRKGIPTASEFQTILTKGRGGGPSLTRRTYMLKLAGEILTGEPMDSANTFHMERGKALEPEARDLYAFLADCEPQQVGLITSGRAGCSPDSLIGSPGMLEIKTKLPHLLLDAMLNDAFLDEHKAQCQGQLWIAEREWVDLAVYWPGLPLFVKRAYRDEAYIKTLAEAVDAFNAELDEVVEKVRARQADGYRDAA
jgi:hypothetical protein